MYKIADYYDDPKGRRRKRVAYECLYCWRVVRKMKDRTCPHCKTSFPIDAVEGRMNKIGDIKRKKFTQFTTDDGDSWTGALIGDGKHEE